MFNVKKFIYLVLFDLKKEEEENRYVMFNV